MKAPVAATSDDRSAAGSSPVDPGPLAQLDPALTRRAVDTAMVKVMDWQLHESEPHFNQLWTYAALYDGLLAASAQTSNSKGS